MRIGITPEKITHVIFTHAHADHLWGVIDPLDGGSRFSNARHFMTAAEFGFWSKPGREGEVPEFFKPMTIGTQRRLKVIGERITQTKAGEEIASGVQLFDTAGHTPGHVSVMLRSGSEKLLIGGDALIHPSSRSPTLAGAGVGYGTRSGHIDPQASVADVGCRKGAAAWVSPPVAGPRPGRGQGLRLSLRAELIEASFDGFHVFHRKAG